ncbi:MAG TPA: hypothetical protein VGC42_13200, partial [Kofleriaceae bacterium]
MHRLALGLAVVLLCGVGMARADVAPDVTASISAAKAALPACEAAHCLGLQLHVTLSGDDHGLIATPAWLAAELATANRHFAAID